MQESCRECEELNAIDDPGMCRSWQCSRREMSEGVCVVDLRDTDGDGSPDPECALDDREPDCDEDNPVNGWLLPEACDLVDNDCDGTIDEGQLTAQRANLLTANDVDALAFARGDMEVAAAYESGFNLVAATLPVVGSGANAHTLSAGDNPDPRGVAITRTGTDWAVAFAPRPGCSRIVLGAWPGTGTTFLVPPDHLQSGLPKVTGTCTSGDVTPAGFPAIASTNPGQVLVAFLADGGPNDMRQERPCEPPPVDVLLVATQRDTSPGAFDRPSAMATSIGQSVDPGPPAVLALDEARGYLVAFPTPDNQIVIVQAQVDASTSAVTAVERLREPCGGVCGDVRIALESVSGQEHVALTYRRGVCTDAAAVLRVFRLDANVLTAVGDARVFATGPSVRYPTATRRADPAEWLLAWVVNAGVNRTVRVARADDLLVPIGEPLTVLQTTGTFGTRLAVAGSDAAGGLAAFAYDRDARQFTRAAAGCLGN